MNDTEKAISDLRSDCQNVHLDAIWRLFDSKDVRAVQPLIESLGDSSLEVQRVAALALGEIRDPRAVEPLARILDDGKCDPRLTENATWSLCQIGDARALRPALFVLHKSRHLIIGVKNNIDEQRRRRLSSIPVYLDSESCLSQAKHNLLRDTFNKIEALNKANYNSSLTSIDPARKG